MFARASAVLFATALLLPSTAKAAPPHAALVIGNGTYASLPPLPGCLLSAHAVAGALRASGFAVVEREDATGGATDAAIGEFAGKLAQAPGTVALVYFCGYVTSFNSRPFLLPVSANIARPTDVLSQGVLAKTLLDVLGRGGSGASVVAIDAVPAPGAPPLSLDTLTQADPAGDIGLIAASSKTGDTPTPLATSLIAQLKGENVQTAPLLAAIQQQLQGGQLAALHQPATSGYLIGAAPAPPAAPTTPPPVTAAPAVPPLPITTASMPADDQMTEADRKRVQSALARLGYYDGQIDGIFGPDTRAAIRRYQHELRDDMTGRLTAPQASKLVDGK